MCVIFSEQQTGTKLFFSGQVATVLTIERNMKHQLAVIFVALVSSNRQLGPSLKP